MLLPKILAEMLALPTAPFVEDAVRDYVLTACGRLPGVTVKPDRWGNLLARYSRSPRAKRPPVFTAHMDHPGFCALAMAPGNQLRAAFRGWVEPEYFVGTGVRFWNGSGWVLGRINRISKEAPVYGMIGRTARPEEVIVDIAGDVPVNMPGMWDLPEPALKNGNVHARGCDDIAGCAAMIALLERLSTSKAKAAAYCLFTRAEEVGFIGAIGAAKSGTIPRRLPIIAIETSRALTPEMIGSGPVLRVGDKSSIFTPEITAFCNRMAQLHAKKDPDFKWQRKLMDGGTCESTAYYAYGYATTGVCLALGNYHNMNTQTRRIETEYVSLRDWQQMVDWFETIALEAHRFPGDEKGVKQGLDERFAKHLRLLTPKVSRNRTGGRLRNSPSRRAAAKPR